ncbi:hypothetical protein NUACC26_046100 [Scytonema sp. NUACC26]
MASGQAELHIIERSRRADGQQIWLDTNKMPLHDANGNVFGILLVTSDGSLIWDGILWDISERKRAELDLQQKSLDLEQALKDLQQAQLQIVQSEKMSALVP